MLTALCDAIPVSCKVLICTADHSPFTFDQLFITPCMRLFLGHAVLNTLQFRQTHSGPIIFSDIQSQT